MLGKKKSFFFCKREPISYFESRLDPYESYFGVGLLSTKFNFSRMFLLTVKINVAYKPLCPVIIIIWGVRGRVASGNEDAAGQKKWDTQEFPWPGTYSNKSLTPVF